MELEMTKTPNPTENLIPDSNLTGEPQVNRVWERGWGIPDDKKRGWGWYKPFPAYQTSFPLVKDKQEKDKIRTNQNKTGQKREAWKSPAMPSDTPLCYLCTYEQCGNILSYGTCLSYNSGTGNSFTYDLIPESVDEVQISPNPPLQCHFNIYLCQICESNSQYGYECSQRVPLVYEPKPCYIQNFSDNDYTHDLPCVNPLIDHHCCYKCGNSLNDFFCPHCTCEFCENGPHITIAQNKLMEQLTSMCEMVGQLIQKKQEEKQIEEEQAANARYWKIPACCNDDDDYNFAITPNELVDSLSMGDEHLDTVLATESNEFIKSSVENLVPNLSESEGESECDVPASFTTFSNVLFDADYEVDSSDDQPASFDAESDLIASMLNHDSSIISSSSKIDSLLDEFACELTLLKSIQPGIDKTDCHPENEIRLIKRLLCDNSSPRLPEEFVSENSNADIESFSPSPIPVEDSDYFMEEIDLSFNPDDPMPPGIEDDDYDSERDIPILEELLNNYSLSLPENESFHFDILSFSRPPAKPPDGNTRILNIKMMGDISKQKLSATCPMMIHGKNIPILDVPLFHFYPLDQLKYGGN
uniref:Uncharacterized protein n=1 Tax=Tanacetum cinerariifolium TaxID=118510 RepID=A0A6L2KDH3_TANCI|nr:hypothetical protein [Tanacetum cinerariifolium]